MLAHAAILADPSLVDTAGCVNKRRVGKDGGVDHVELREGDRVALVAPGSLLYVDAVMSLLADGVFPIPLDPRLTSYERERILASLEPRLVVEDEEALRSLVDPSVAPVDRRPRGRPIHVTSGTTGTPKGVYSGLLD